MKLSEIIAALPEHEMHRSADIEIDRLEFDSRRVGGGTLFVCLEGLASNGHDFAAAAVSSGARALVVNYLLPEIQNVPQVIVPDTRVALARLALEIYGYPARRLRVAGVTGTNGKTTVTQLLRSVGVGLGKRADVFGTLGHQVGGEWQVSRFTTPEAPEVQRLLREAADRGAEWVAMEVSSHALAQRRVFGLDFSAVVFTNLTRDHLDYHQSFERYRDAKNTLFTREGRGSERESVAVLNFEDPVGRTFFADAPAPKVSYGFRGGTDYRARRVRVSPAGTRFEMVTPRGRADVSVRLTGRFNALNALAAAAVAMEWGAPLDAVAESLGRAEPVRGRMEVVEGTHPFTVVIDYAHTPDALSLALEAARGFTRRRLLLVFGCGGDRDRGKRPEMGRVAAESADRVWVTSDNPRGEDPATIIEEVAAGAAPGRFRLVVDRKEAIAEAMAAAKAGDTVMIAGKGHETVQIAGGEERPFDDRAVAEGILENLG